jgi:predicted RNA-binding protein with PIN domain
MSAGLLLIDGYNLLHAAGMAQSNYRRGDLLRCRTRLLRFLLSNLTPAEICGTTVIFDAREPPPDRPASLVVSGIRVLFANPGGDADVLIQSWLERHPTPRRVTLVSSDRLLQRAARSRGSKFIGSEDFVHDLEARRTASLSQRGAAEMTDASKPRPQASAEQTAYWLKVFGDVPVVPPDADDTTAPAEPPHTAANRPTREPSRARRSMKSRKPDRQKDSKSTGNVSGDELAYWMNVFGNRTAGDSAGSANELSLSDLENWLKDFESTGRDPAKKRK